MIGGINYGSVMVEQYYRAVADEEVWRTLDGGAYNCNWTRVDSGKCYGSTKCAARIGSWDGSTPAVSYTYPYNMFPQRVLFTAAIDRRDGRDIMYVIGGCGMMGPGLMNDGCYYGGTWIYDDVWISYDQGQRWTKVTTQGSAAAGTFWSARHSLTSVVDSRGYLYIIGGSKQYDGAPSSNYAFSEVWVSKDYGVSWTLVSTGSVAAGTMWSARSGHGSVIDSNDRIYVIGGNIDTDQTLGCCGWVASQTNEVWRSDNYGETWALVSVSSREQTLDFNLFRPRFFHSVSIDCDDNIYVVGGYGYYLEGSTTNVRSREIWRSQDGGGKQSQCFLAHVCVRVCVRVCCSRFASLLILLVLTFSFSLLLYYQPTQYTG